MIKKLAFVHGWSNGPRLDRKIAEAIKNSGFEYCRSAADADIVLAHSLGIFALPKKYNPKLLIAVNPAYWPGKTIIKSIAQNIKDEDTYSNGWRRSIYILANQFFYVLMNLPSDIFRFRRARSLKWPRATKVVIIRNESDAFCSPKVRNVIPKGSDFIQLPGSHGDIYRSPEKYIKLVEKYAKQLV